MPVRIRDKSRAKTFAGVSLPYLEYRGNREQETKNAEGFRCNLFLDENAPPYAGLHALFK
jgi:hypothetical protein